MMNEKTRKLLDGFINQPSSSIILEGSEASGVWECAGDMTNKLLGKKYAGNKIQLEPDKGSIGINVVRELKQRLATIAGDDQPVTRIAIISSAESLTTEAQNALLKLIEEPVRNTLLILITTDRTQLLETIQSRCQTIQILPITKDQAREYCDANDIDQKTCDKSYLLSQGQAKLFADLVHERDTSVTQQVESAKTFLAQKPFERLTRQKEFDTTEHLQSLLSSLKTVAEAGLHASTTATSRRWQKTLREVRTSSELLKQNTNTKLVFLRVSIML